MIVTEDGGWSWLDELWGALGCVVKSVYIPRGGDCIEIHLDLSYISASWRVPIYLIYQCITRNHDGYFFPTEMQLKLYPDAAEHHKGQDCARKSVSQCLAPCQFYAFSSESREVQSTYASCRPRYNAGKCLFATLILLNILDNAC